jgi:HD-like signal output (HDOD) protein
MALSIVNLALASQKLGLQTLRDLPPFTPALHRLLATLSNENASTALIVAIVESDPVLAGNVLKLVNSAAFDRRHAVNSIHHAVTLIGIDKLRNMVFGSSIANLSNRIKTPPEWSTNRFNLHSVACGVMCDALTEHLELDYADCAFTAGLFHDLGAMLIAVGMHDSHTKIKELYAAQFGTMLECEQSVMGITHADLSADALAFWKLPATLQRVARFHHEPEKDSGEPGHKGFTLTRIVFCADAYLETRGLSLGEKPDALSHPELADEPFLPLEIKIADAEFLDKFDADLQVLAGTFR